MAEFTLGCRGCNQERDTEVIFLLDKNRNWKGEIDTNN